MDSNHHDAIQLVTFAGRPGGLPHITNLFRTHHPRDRRARLPISSRNNTAEEQGFEPQIPFSMPVFKTGAFNHSAISPNLLIDMSFFISEITRI